MQEIKKIFSPEGRNLIREFVIANFKRRYKGTALGFLWYILYPLLMFVVLYAVFSRTMGEKIAHYPLFLLCGIIMWSFFERTTGECLPVVYNNSELLKNTNFLRETLVISPALTNVLGLFLEIGILSVFLVIFGRGLAWPNLFFIVILFCEFLIVEGISFILSTLFVFHRDIMHIWRVVMRLAFFATPIFYPESAVPRNLSWIIRLNPFTYLLRLGRDTFVYGRPPEGFILSMLMISSFAIFIFGYQVFKKKEPIFAERM